MCSLSFQFIEQFESIKEDMKAKSHEKKDGDHSVTNGTPRTSVVSAPEQIPVIKHARVNYTDREVADCKLLKDIRFEALHGGNRYRLGLR